MSTSKSCHFCGKNIVKEFDALNDNVNRSNEEVTKETDEKITTKRWSSHCHKILLMQKALIYEGTHIVDI